MNGLSHESLADLRNYKFIGSIGVWIRHDVPTRMSSELVS